MAQDFFPFRSSWLGDRAMRIGDAWTEAWSSTAFRAHAIVTPVALGATLFLLGHVLPWVERRTAVVPLADPVLAALTPRDLTWLTFSLIYAGLIVGLGRLVARPRELVTGVQAYVFLLLLRMVAMYLAPLAAPAGDGQRPGVLEEVDGVVARTPERLEPLSPDGAPLDVLSRPAHDRPRPHARRARGPGSRSP